MPDHREQSQSLRQRLNDHTIDIELLAKEAYDIFDAARSPVHVRWLRLELQGYGAVDGSSPLHEVLGVHEGDRLAVHVLTYRAQEGQVIEGGQPTGRPLRHFFIEPLREISAASGRLQGGSPGALQLDFDSPEGTGHQVIAEFPADVFDRVLLGFRAVLHLQLTSIAP